MPASTASLGISVSVPEEIPGRRRSQVVFVIKFSVKSNQERAFGEVREAWEGSYRFLGPLPSGGVWD